LISGFRHDIDEICTLLGYWPWKMGPICRPETSVNNYHTTPRNNPEECRSIIKAIKLKMRWIRQAAIMGGMRNMYKILLGKPENTTWEI
jgi:hypothetical protein